MSANLAHKKSLRTKAEIDKELNHKVYELGSCYANIDILKDTIEANIQAIKRLTKEQAKPLEGEKEAPKESFQEPTPIAAEDAHVTQ